MIGRPGADFSLSGLKTAVRLEAERDRAADRRGHRRSLRLASRRRSSTWWSTARGSALARCSAQTAGHPSALVVAGGVAANQPIRTRLQRFAAKSGLQLVAPPLALCTDNGAMIAWAGLERLRLGLVDDMTAPARARWPLDQTRDEAGAKAMPSASPAPAPGAPRLPIRRRRGRQRGRALAADAARAEAMARERVNARFLPGLALDPRVRPTAALQDLAAADSVLLVTPAQTTRAVVRELAPVLSAATPLVLCAKGIERGTNRFLCRSCAKSGPARPSPCFRGRASRPTSPAACRRR